MSDRYLSHQFFEQIRERVRSGAEPWAAAGQHLVTQAAAALEREPLTIRDNGGSPHFRVDAVYVPGQDGVHNRDANLESGRLATRAARAARDLALAWRLTGEPRYADKALQFLHTWCIDQDTRMFPAGRVEDAHTPGAVYGGDVVAFEAFWRLFLAVYLLGDYAGWNLDARAAVRRWVRAMIDPQRELMFFAGDAMYNNWEDVRLRYLATGALATGDLDLLSETFNRWRRIIAIKMTEEGELPRETMRTRSLTYTIMALSATTHVAEIAGHYGEDLYDWSANGRCLKRAIDYAAGYLLDIETWPHTMMNPVSDASGRIAALFETTGSRWGDEQHAAVVQAYGGRPATEDHATLLAFPPDAQ